MVKWGPTLSGKGKHSETWQRPRRTPVGDWRQDASLSSAVALQGRHPRLDYLLRYTRDLPLAVVEAKASNLPAADGLLQAIDYAQSLGLPFAYATNGIEIIEHDFLTGQEATIGSFPSPDELWQRYKLNAEVSDAAERILLTPGYDDLGRPARYY